MLQKKSSNDNIIFDTKLFYNLKTSDESWLIAAVRSLHCGGDEFTTSFQKLKYRLDKQGNIK